MKVVLDDQTTKYEVHLRKVGNNKQVVDIVYPKESGSVELDKEGMKQLIRVLNFLGQEMQ